MTLRFFWHLMSSNWTTMLLTVSIWMFIEIVILTIFKAKWRIFYILKNFQGSIPLSLINKSIWTQKGVKRSVKSWTKILWEFSSKLKYLSTTLGFGNPVGTVLWIELDPFFGRHCNPCETKLYAKEDYLGISPSGPTFCLGDL